MKTAKRFLLAVGLGAAVVGAARADVITDWNVATFDVMRSANVAGAPAARALAMVHVAMADAVNSVQSRYNRYAYRGPLQPTALPEVAASSAARTTLVTLFPAQKAKIDEIYAASIAGIPDSPAKAEGAALGEQAAAAAIADRATDNSSVPDTYRPITTPGVWIPTTPPLTAEYARVKPWGFDRPDQFRPGPPPALTSAEYARDYNETKTLGGVRSTQRTPAQSEAVKFWSQANLPLAWHQAARQLGAARKLSLSDNARLFALLSMAQANTFIVDWDAKFHYNFWRPVTAIRNGDIDGNDATERDAGWSPLNVTPMHPEYPSQAAIIAGAAAALLAHVFNDPKAGPILVVDSADSKLTRQLETLAALGEEHGLVRIWGGIHFRTSLEVSDRMGRALVGRMIESSYRPVR